MQVVKKTTEYKIYRRGDERYSVLGPNRRRINGDEKVAILKEAGLITLTEPKPKVEEPAPVAEGEAESAEGAE